MWGPFLRADSRRGTVEDPCEAFREAGVEASRWYGIRVLSVARLVHLVGRKKLIQG